MTIPNGFIFIDANNYLDLYRVTTGKKLLDPLIEQQEHIFVNLQIVEEVERNKLGVAKNFLDLQFAELKVRNFDVPDHLFDVSGETHKTLCEMLKKLAPNIEQINDTLEKAGIETLGRISRSEDEVTKALREIFRNAVPHTDQDLEKARNRKERGNPPGKPDDPLGDQLTWEQLLIHYKNKPKVWIISKDSDYCTKHRGKLLLNPLLRQDLARVSGGAPEVYCFDSIDEGIRDFVKTMGVKAERLPTPEESREIGDELDALPSLAFTIRGMDTYPYRKYQDGSRFFGFYNAQETPLPLRTASHED